jgi:hypothetical protein
VRTNPVDNTDAGALLIDWPLFLAAMAAYGFADLSLRLAAGGLQTIRVSAKAMRIRGEQQQRLPLRHLTALTGAKRVFAVSSAGPSSTGPPFARFLRMTCPVGEIA